MKNRLVSHGEFVVDIERMSGIGVAIVLRKVAARDFDPNPVPFLENIAGIEQIHRKFVRPTRLQQFRILEGKVVARSQHSVGHVVRRLAGPGNHVNQFHGPIGIGRGGRGKQFGDDGAGDLNIFA